MKSFKLIFKSFKKVKFKIILYIIFSILIAYLTTFIPVIIQNFIDFLLQGSINSSIILSFLNLFKNYIPFIYLMCILLFLTKLVTMILTYFRSITKDKIIQEFQFNIKKTLFTHIQSLTYHDFYKKSLAELVQNMADDINNIVAFIDKQLVYILDIILTIVFAIYQLSKLNLSLAFILIFTFIIMLFASIWIFKKSHTIIQKSIIARKKLYEKLDDNYSNIKFMKLNNLQKKEIQEFSFLNNQDFKINEEKIAADAVYNMGAANIVKLQNPLIFILGTILYSKDLISIGSIYVTISYSNKISRGFQSFSEMFESFNAFIISYLRINELLNLTLEKNIDNKNINSYEIVFKNANIIVNEKCLLKNLNFTIEPNDKILVVGATGSGKTIFAKTLVGFYDYEGSITIGGKEVKDLDKKTIRENICLLLQDSYLFSKTIAENIKILVPYLPDDKMIELSKEFALHSDVLKFNNKYDSLIGKNGLILSKGQRQRLVLIRAFTKVKPLMIFDDSFSAIDKINKKIILSNLLNNNDNSTKIFITHNIGLAPKFKKILFFNNNEGILGTHEELMNNSDYKNLYELSLNNLGDDYD